MSDEVWTIREVYFEGKFDMIEFKLRNVMGEEGNEEFLPVHLNLDINFRFMGNHLAMKAEAWVKYDMVNFYQGGERRKSQKKHSHDLTEFYELTSDSTSAITDYEKFKELRPIPLTDDEEFLYLKHRIRNGKIDWIFEEQANKPEPKKSTVFWGQLGDMLISSYNVNLAGLGSVRCSPLINPVKIPCGIRRKIEGEEQ